MNKLVTLLFFVLIPGMCGDDRDRVAVDPDAGPTLCDRPAPQCFPDEAAADWVAVSASLEADELAGLVPARAVDWIELRAGATTFVSTGTACATASDPGRCMSALRSASGTGFIWLDHSPSPRLGYLVATRSDEVEVIDSPAGLLLFLGSIDTVEEATLLVRTQTDAANRGRTPRYARPFERAIELLADHYVGVCDPIVLAREHWTVWADGTVDGSCARVVSCWSGCT